MAITEEEEEEDEENGENAEENIPIPIGDCIKYSGKD